MKFGMLWFDGSKKPLKQKVAAAAAYYTKKFGVAPTECHVNPSEWEAVDGMKMVKDAAILAGHLWIGRKDE